MLNSIPTVTGNKVIASICIIVFTIGNVNSFPGTLNDDIAKCTINGKVKGDIKVAKVVKLIDRARSPLNR